MSLRLDGLLGDADERGLDEHIAGCAECAMLWTMMQQADSMLRASSAQPLPVPANLHSRIMAEVAVTPLSRPISMPTPVREPALAGMPGTRSQGADTAVLPFDPIEEWQDRLAGYVRAVAVAGLSFAGGVLLLLALVMSGVVDMDGPLAEPVAVLRTLFEAAGTWLRSISISLGSEIIVMGGLVFGLLALIGWQIMSSYYRTAGEQTGTTTSVEVAA
jgi:hypothetical protein